MKVHNQLFNNLFGSRRITPIRFRNFCRFALNALTQANADSKYNDAIAQIQTVLDNLNAELSDVDSGLTEQVNSTSEMTSYIQTFGKYMQTAAGAIAFNVGGKDTAAYRAFYPYKPEEYYRATKGNMTDLTARVAMAANKYTDQLGEKLTTDLKAFAPGFQDLVNSQEAQMTAVSQDRKERNLAFMQGQWTLTGIVHDVASLNNGNPDETGKLFPFSMLYPVRKDNRITFKASLKLSEQKELQNRTLTEKVTVAVQNTALNADVLVWLAASPTAAVPDTAVLVKADSEMKIKADKLGDLAGTFLMIKNASIINAASYIVKVSGQSKKEDTTTPAVAEDKALHIA